MGLDMDFYKLPKGTKVENFEVWLKLDTFKYFRKNYTIHEIMCLSRDLVARGMTVADIPPDRSPFPYTFGCGEYKISKKQYEVIKEILEADDLGKLVRDYNEDDKPEQLLEILKDFDDYDFWYSWVN